MLLELRLAAVDCLPTPFGRRHTADARLPQQIAELDVGLVDLADLDGALVSRGGRPGRDQLGFHA